jgi:tetratricopeptide (TPR) repeat protein
MRGIEVNREFWWVLVLAVSMAGWPRLFAQTPGGSNGSGSPAPSATPQKQPAPQTDSNPFPEDTNSVPVIENRPTPEKQSGFSESDAGDVRVPIAGDATDPVRSPDDPAPGTDSLQDAGSSSSLKGIEGLLPPPDADEPDRKHKKEKEPTHQEVAAQDLNVGGYYLDKKNWRAALSRFQSAMVLDPENPDVYWGLAEAENHLGDYAAARAYYEKLLDYDPDGPHGKQARKALKEPALASAHAALPTAASPQPTPQQ